jgi:hypothetical protein
MTGVFRAKRGKINYFLNGRNYCLKELYLYMRRRLRKKKNCKWKTASIIVKLNLSDDKKKEEWIDVKLVFSAPKNQKMEQWAAFLSTDISLKNEKIRLFTVLCNFSIILSFLLLVNQIFSTLSIQYLCNHKPAY